MENHTKAISKRLILPVEDIEADQLQVRVAGLNDAHVRVLGESVDSLPPVTVVWVADRWVLVDGHHTLAAVQNAGAQTVQAWVVDTPADGDLVGLAFARNAEHGLALTLADRRAFAAHLIGADPQTSNMEVSRRAGLSPSTVAALRDRLEAGTGTAGDERRVSRSDSTYTYPGTQRQAGALPDETLTSSVVDGLSAAWSSTQRRAQRRVARYLDRLVVALNDRQSLAGWDDAATVAIAYLVTHDADKAAELAERLYAAAADLSAVARAISTALTSGAR